MHGHNTTSYIFFYWKVSLKTEKTSTCNWLIATCITFHIFTILRCVLSISVKNLKKVEASYLMAAIRYKCYKFYDPILLIYIFFVLEMPHCLINQMLLMQFVNSLCIMHLPMQRPSVCSLIDRDKSSFKIHIIPLVVN